MSNTALTVVTLAALGLHLLALIVAIRRRRPKVLARFVLIFAAATVFLVALTARSAWPPIGPAATALLLLELAIAAVAITALLRGSRWAAAVTYAAFGLHTLMSAGAVLFALTFKIDRLF